MAKKARVENLNVNSGLTFSDETHVVSAALAAQGVALMSKKLIEDELNSGRLIQPFGPAVQGQPFFLVYPENRRDDPLIKAVHEWVVSLASSNCIVTR